MFDKWILAATAVLLSSCATGNAQTSLPVSATTPEDWAKGCEPWDEWDKPAAPFKIYGGTYYVGTCGIAAILVVGDESSPLDGHTLIDTGTAAGSQIVLANIASLGFDVKKVKVLLSSHEHFDHVGGMLNVWKATGGEIVASEIGLDAMIAGNVGEDDPQFGMHEPMAKIPFGRPHKWGDTPWMLSVFGMKAIETPGHTPGALSWQWESCARKDGGDDCKTIVYADSLSPVSRDDYKFSDHPEYLAAYRAGIDRLAKLKCDILLTPHPSHSKMIERAATGSFEGGVTCEQYAAGKQRDLDARLEREAGE